MTVTDRSDFPAKFVSARSISLAAWPLLVSIFAPNHLNGFMVQGGNTRPLHSLPGALRGCCELCSLFLKAALVDLYCQVLTFTSDVYCVFRLLQMDKGDFDPITKEFLDASYKEQSDQTGGFMGTGLEV